MGINVGDKYIIEIGAVAELPDGKKKYFIKPFESLVFDRKGLEQLERLDKATGNIYQTSYEEGYTKAQARLDLKQLKDDSYNKGYEDGAKIQDEVQYKKSYEKGFEDGKKQAIEEIPELANKENEMYNDGYNKGYNSAINDYNAMYEWLHDCFVDFEKFLLEKGFYTDEKFSDGFVVGQLMYDLICDHDIAEVISEFKKWQEEKKKPEDEPIKVGDEVIYLPNNIKFYVIGESPSSYIGIYYAKYNKYLPILLCDFEKDKCKKTGKHLEEISQLLDKLRGEDNDNN